jgi:hypothetical protein
MASTTAPAARATNGLFDAPAPGNSLAEGAGGEGGYPVPAGGAGAVLASGTLGGGAGYPVPAGGAGGGGKADG